MWVLVYIAEIICVLLYNTEVIWVLAYDIEVIRVLVYSTEVTSSSRNDNYNEWGGRKLAAVCGFNCGLVCNEFWSLLSLTSG
jgi:hypothetical protein